MTILLNHTIVPAQEKEVEAGFFAAIFGLPDPVTEGRFAAVHVNEGLTFYFAATDSFESHHYAFLVSEEDLTAILGRVRAAGLAYGSEPGKETDGQLNDWEGGKGFYFRDPDGHLLELMTRSHSEADDKNSMGRGDTAKPISPTSQISGEAHHLPGLATSDADARFILAINALACPSCSGLGGWQTTRTGDGYLTLECGRCHARIAYHAGSFASDTGRNTACDFCGSRDLEPIESGAGFAEFRCKACGTVSKGW